MVIKTETQSILKSLQMKILNSINKYIIVGFLYFFICLVYIWVMIIILKYCGFIWII